MSETVDSISQEMSGRVPVLSLVIFDGAERSRLLLGVRRAAATSARHPDVLSTPTMRIPPGVMGDLLEEVDVAWSDLGINDFRSIQCDRPRRIGVPFGMSDSVVFASEHLMARKLGWSDALVRSEVTGTVVRAALGRDLVGDGESGEAEDTLMLSVVVELEGAVPLGATGSYSRLDWVDATKVVEAVSKKDPLLLITGAYPWEVCLHGLCVRSAAFALGS